MLQCYAFKNKKNQNSIKRLRLLLNNLFWVWREIFKLDSFYGALVTYRSFSEPLINVLNSYVYAQILNNIVIGLTTDTDVVPTISVFLGIEIFIRFYSELFYSFVNHYEFQFDQKLNEKIEMQNFDKFASLDVQEYENPKSNILMQKIRSEGSWTVKRYFDSSQQVPSTLLKILSSVIVIFTLNPLIIFFFILITIPSIYIQLTGEKQRWNIWESNGNDKKEFNESLNSFSGNTGIMTNRPRLLKDYMKERGLKYLRIFQSQEININRKNTIRRLPFSLLREMGIIVVYVWLVFEIIIKKTMEVGGFAFYSGYITGFSYSLVKLSREVKELYKSDLFVVDYRKFLNLEVRIKSKPNSLVLDANNTPKIEFRNVSFKYPYDKSRSDYVFKDLNLVIEPGEDIAIVGENGAGKSTFIKLLMRFYDPVEGEILINGINLKDINLESWYRLIGYLPQNFHYTIMKGRETIYLGDIEKENNMDNIIRASKLGGVHKLISKMKKGYDTYLSAWFNGGTDLSGGQYQKIELAKVFFKDPKVYLLDEPTSAMDSKAEFRLFKKLQKIAEGRTTILISHRFSTVRKAHKIYVFEHGEVIEAGSHEELISISGGKYKEMFEKQAEGYL